MRTLLKVIPFANEHDGAHQCSSVQERTGENGAFKPYLKLVVSLFDQKIERFESNEAKPIGNRHKTAKASILTSAIL